MCIKATKRFLNAVLDLPEHIATKLGDVIKKIQTSPSPDALKIVNERFWRICITNKYRLFYEYSDCCLNLLDIRKREKDTYKDISELSKKPLFPSDDDDQSDSLQSSLLCEKQLRRWNIPTKYDKILLELKTEEDLNRLIEQHPEIDYRYIAKIIDILDRSLENVSKETFYEINSSESLVDFYHSQELNKFLLALSDDQKKIAQMPCDCPIQIGRAHV